MDSERLPFPLSSHRVKLLLRKGWSRLRVPQQEPPPRNFRRTPGIPLPSRCAGIARPPASGLRCHESNLSPGSHTFPLKFLKQC